MNCKIFYRISSKGLLPKLAGATKKRCLDNFVNVFGKDITVIADHCTPELMGILSGLNVIETDLGNSRSFRYALGLTENLPADMPVYFVEDDYLHLPNARQILEEGMVYADYITLYDHPDKYEYHYEYAEMCKVFRTRSTHWRTSISTCMTFATRAGILREDLSIWEEALQQEIPADHPAFNKLRDKGRTLIVPIPGAAVHTDLSYSMLVGKNLMESWAIQMMIKEIEQSIYKSWDADAIELMETIMHHQSHPPMELLALISEIEAFSLKKKSEQTVCLLALEVTNPTELTTE